jgi:hypothetical protein
MKQRLEILASWMKDFNVSIDPYTDGIVESAIKRQKEETIRCIGDLLEDILSMDDEQMKNELK